MGLALAAGLLLAYAAPPAARAERPSERTAWEEELERGRRDAIRRGCAYIASRQRSDGGFGDDNAVVAVTALSVLALMADGSTDGRGPYGQQVRRGIDFLLKLVQQPRQDRWHPGYFYYRHDLNSRMHGQGYATLALATALGTSTGRRYREIREVLTKAVACIEQAQTTSGGFGYEPLASQEHEGSVTVTVAQGLRAAHDAGIVVDANVVKRGLFYLKRSQNEDGSFRYSVHSRQSSYALTAAALSSFFLYGRYTDDDTLRRGFRYLMGQVGLASQMRWYYYGNFYAAWACWQRDGSAPGLDRSGTWARWHRLVYPEILDRQRRSDGSWYDPLDQFGFGPLVPTTFAVLTLAVPDEVLPVFQR